MSFTIGALRHLYDVVGIHPNVVAGSSAGAIVGSFLAQGGTQAEQRAALADIEAIWRGMTASSDMYAETAWFSDLRRIAPEWLEVFQRRRRKEEPGGRAPVGAGVPPEDALGGQQNIADWPPLRAIDALLAMRTLGRTRRDLEGVLAAAEHAQGIFTPGRVAQQLASPEVFDATRVAASGVRLRLAVVGLESGHLRYVTEHGRLVDRDDQPVADSGVVQLPDAVLASSAIPVVFPPVVLDGEHYVDGGMREVLPLQIARRGTTEQRCYAVVASTVGLRPQPAIGKANMLAIAYRSFSEILWDEVLHDEVEAARAAPDVTLIQPEFDVHDQLTVDPALIALAMDYGWMRAADVVAGDDAEERDRTRLIVETRREVWSLENAQQGTSLPAGEESSAALLAEARARVRELVAQKDAARLPAGAEQWGRRPETHGPPSLGSGGDA